MSAPPATVVLVPIRSFDDAKQRLAVSLAPAVRRSLVQRMAEVVIEAAHDLPVRIVTDDDEVAAWAATRRTTVVGAGVAGLNPSITVAAEKAAADGIERVIIAHADLPLARDLRVVAGPGVAIAPDRRRDGSNVMSVPTGVGFRFAYGPGSFTSHRVEAERLGLEFTVIDDPSLALDVDEPDDLPPAWAAAAGGD